MDRNPDSPWNPATPVKISPTEFEEQVLAWLQRSIGDESPPAKTTHQAIVTGPGGAYAVDILVELSILGGARLLVLVECKHHRRPVERDDVLALEAKIRDVGAHKGMLFSTSGFQSGAIKYSAERGIATVTVVSGQWLFETRGAERPPPPPPWARLPRYAGIRLSPTEKGIGCQTIETQCVEPLTEWLAGRVAHSS